MSVLRRTITGTAIGVGVALLLWLDTVVPGGFILWAVLGLCGVVAAQEAGNMARGLGQRLGIALPAAVLATIAFGFLLATGRLPEALSGLGKAEIFGVVCVVAAVTGFLLAPRRPAGPLLALWIAPALVSLALITQIHGHGALVALILLSKVGDIAGYYGGKRFGRTHPFPRLSPGKTTEGCLASLIAGVAVGGLLTETGLLGEDWELTSGLLAGAAVNLAAQAGDLLESAVKRKSGVKDSGTLMGASGGLLDVLDSFLLTAPLAWLCS